MKPRKASGIDGLQSEHLKYGGSLLILWLRWNFSAFVHFEYIPPCILTGIIQPIYKGKGKDPLCCDSYRGISITSVFMKLFEYALLERIMPVLQENGDQGFYKLLTTPIFGPRNCHIWLLHPTSCQFIEHFSNCHITNSVSLNSLMFDLTSESELSTDSFHCMKSLFVLINASNILYCISLSAFLVSLHPLSLGASLHKTLETLAPGCTPGLCTCMELYGWKNKGSTAGWFVFTTACR